MHLESTREPFILLPDQLPDSADCFWIREDSAKTYRVNSVCASGLTGGLYYLKQLRALLLGSDVCWNLLICTMIHITLCRRWSLVGIPGVYHLSHGRNISY